jgi:hypothetical protein
MILKRFREKLQGNGRLDSPLNLLKEILEKRRDNIVLLFSLCRNFSLRNVQLQIQKYKSFVQYTKLFLYKLLRHATHILVGDVKETPSRRITATSSLHEISKDQWPNS